MALIRCPECGKEISDQTPACIYCGYPLKIAQGIPGEKKAPQKPPSLPRVAAPGERSSAFQEPKPQSGSPKIPNYTVRPKKRKTGRVIAIVIAAIVALLILIAIFVPAPEGKTEDILNQDVTTPIWERTELDIIQGMEARLKEIDTNYSLETVQDEEPGSKHYELRYAGEATQTNVYVYGSGSSDDFSIGIWGKSEEGYAEYLVCVVDAFLLESDLDNKYATFSDANDDFKAILNNMGSRCGTTVLNGLSISSYFNDNNENMHFIISCVTEEAEQETDPSQAAPSPEPVPASPEPVTYTGSGDDVIDIEPPTDQFVLQITGNGSARHFAVQGYDSQGEPTELFVNTTDPYTEGITIDPTFTTTTLEISATGAWSISLTPLQSLEQITAGTTLEGTGDQVLLVSGNPTRASITGNAGAHHFAVTVYGPSGSDLLVNTTDPYEGNVMVTGDPVVLEVDSEDAWSILLE